MRRIFVRVPVGWTVHRWESKRPRLASRPVVPLAMMMTTGGISGWRARMACQVCSGMVSTRLAASEYPPGMPASALGGAVGPGLLWPLPWALSSGERTGMRRLR